MAREAKESMGVESILDKLEESDKEEVYRILYGKRLRLGFLSVSSTKEKRTEIIFWQLFGFSARIKLFLSRENIVFFCDNKRELCLARKSKKVH